MVGRTVGGHTRSLQLKVAPNLLGAAGVFYENLPPGLVELGLSILCFFDRDQPFVMSQGGSDTSTSHSQPHFQQEGKETENQVIFVFLSR